MENALTACRLPSGSTSGGENAEGEACVKAHLDYYRDVDLDFIKIMSDGLNYPLSVKIDCAADWNQVKPLPRDHAFFTGTLERCRRINEELNGECCTFYNMFSPFNIVRERDVFTEHALAGRTWDQTVMAHLQEDEEALKHAMDVIGEDLAYPRGAHPARNGLRRHLSKRSGRRSAA